MSMYPALGSQIEFPFLPLSGGTLTGNLTLPSSGTLQWSSSTKLRASSDGVLRITTAADGNGSLLLGTADATGCLLIHSGTAGIVQARLGNNGGAGSFLGSVFYGSYIIFNGIGGNLLLTTNAGSPEASISTATGAAILDSTNGRFYIKGSGTGNTGYLETAEVLLKTTTGIDTSSTNKQTLYTVPTGRTAYITKVVIRDPSAAITVCQGTFGYDANATDVIGTTNLTGLTGATIYQVATPITTGAVEGAAAAVFGFKTTAQEAAADTVTMDVFGYLR